jgi:hypothetical protein
MGTQTMTENCTGTTSKDWNSMPIGGAVSVVVKRSTTVRVSMSGHNGMGACISMSNADAIEFARAIMAAATGVNCYEDAYEFQHTKDARKVREAADEMREIQTA